jgi:Sulfotransferase domain
VEEHEIAETDMKVVGVGLHKTGTTTLSVCMRHWKFKHISSDRKAFDMYVRGDISGLLEIAAQYDSFEDWPWPLVYREIDRRFPSSKFILTKRSNPQVWFESLCKHAERTGPTNYRRIVYGKAMPHGYKESHIQRYEEHNAEVEAYFRDKPGQLLVVCWENGDGWDELSEFLGLERPSIPFPHANKAANPFVRQIRKMVRSHIGRKRYARDLLP